VGSSFHFFPFFCSSQARLIIDLINHPSLENGEERSTAQARFQTTFPIYIGKLRPNYLQAQSVKIVHLSCVNRVQFQWAQPSLLLGVSD